LEGLGIRLDADANQVRDPGEGSVSKADSPVAVPVIPTIEGLEMARQALEVVGWGQ